MLIRTPFLESIYGDGVYLTDTGINILTGNVVQLF